VASSILLLHFGGTTVENAAACSGVPVSGDGVAVAEPDVSPVGLAADPQAVISPDATTTTRVLRPARITL
jgi:hypothetical protein